jgi:hypothetical protein
LSSSSAYDVSTQKHRSTHRLLVTRAC